MELELKPVNLLHIKQMPGRKSDAKDARRVAELLHGNMCGAVSFETDGQDSGNVRHPVEQLHQQHQLKEFYADC
jgi:hypothetical protein